METKTIDHQIKELEEKYLSDIEGTLKGSLPNYLKLETIKNTVLSFLGKRHGIISPRVIKDTTDIT